MSASEKKNYRVKFYVDRTYEVEFDFHAPDQETANQMVEDMANDSFCDDFLHDLIDDMKDNYQNGDIEKDSDPEETETSYTCMQSRRVADWCGVWEEQQAEDAAEDEEGAR